MDIQEKRPGIYRVVDGSRVSFSDALETWTPLAYDELIATAHKYHTVITYLELSERVQDV